MAAPDPEWQRLAGVLADPTIHGGAPTEVIDTHTARVVLAGARAYKMRRPVDYGWLDYATPARRAAMAEAEVMINAPHAPGLYLGVGGITEAGLSPPGAPLPEGAEPLTVMRRFPAADLLDRMAAEGRLDAELMRETGRAVAAMHRHAPARDAPPDVVGLVAAQAAELAELAGLLGKERVARLAALTESAVAAKAALTAGRRVRACHGDLHLRNIVLWQGRPTPFDAIEFSERLSVIDPLHDLAFLLMDLRHRALPGLATEALNAWAEAMVVEPGAEEGTAYGGLGLLPLYLALRAGVRAKVGALAARDAGGADATARLVEARGYLAEAIGCLEAPPAPMLVAVGGRSGSGKTTLARALAAETGAVVLRSDAIRKGLHGLAETARLPPEAYTREASARVYAAMQARARLALAGGWPVILDAAHLAEGERGAAEALARGTGVPFHGIWLEGGQTALAARVTARRGDASDADAGVVAQQFARETGPIRWAVLAADAPEGVVAARAAAMIAADRQG